MTRSILVEKTHSDPILLRARWVVPMEMQEVGRLVGDGCIAIVGGSIAGVGQLDELQKQFPHARIHDAGSAVILPGLINAHVHLELSRHVAGAPPTRFVDWVMDLIRRSAGAGHDPAAFTQDTTNAIKTGVRQCLQFGVTTVGDISRLCPITRPILKDGPLRVISFGEVAAMAQRRELLEERLAAALTGADLSGRWLRVGISPHAPYSVEPTGYQRCIEAADRADLPLATHLAETADETTFLRDHTGPLRELWEFLGAWDDKVPRFAGGPVRLMQQLGLLDRRSVLAHVNYCDDAELAILADHPRASVVYCPRTHAYFGHPPHRWREMLSQGVNVAIGTDSCASSPDLNLVDDLRLLRRLSPEIAADTLWSMITSRAARALGLESEIGSLTIGTAADFVIFAVSSDDPLTELLDGHVLPTEVWINGSRMMDYSPDSPTLGT